MTMRIPKIIPPQVAQHFFVLERFTGRKLDETALSGTGAPGGSPGIPGAPGGGYAPTTPGTPVGYGCCIGYGDILGPTPGYGAPVLG